MAKRNQNVTFRRIKGRIVPIKKKRNMSGVYGAAGGAYVGGSIGLMTTAFTKEYKASQRHMREIGHWSSKGKVYSRSYIKKHTKGLGKIILVSSMEEAAKHKELRHMVGSPKFEMMMHQVYLGKNAAALATKKNKFILAARKLNRNVIAHEIGHHKYWKKYGNARFYDVGVIGAVSGRLYKQEAGAWKMAPGRISKITKGLTLGTYKAAQRHSRIGAVAGMALGGLYYGLRKNKNK